MSRQRLSQVYVLLIVSLTPLMFYARLAWTQEGPSASKTPTQVSILAAPFAEGPEGGVRFRPAYENLSSPFAPNLEQTPSPPKFHILNLACPFSLTRNDALPDLWQLAKIDEPQVKANYFVGNPPTEWLTNEIPHNMLHYRAPDLDDELQYYGHRIPWAGRIILGIGKQAKSHPRAFSLLEVIDPGLSLDKPHTRWIGK